MKRTLGLREHLVVESVVVYCLVLLLGKIMKCLPSWSGEWFLVEWIKVWIESQILAGDDNSRSVAHTVSDYAVVFCNADKYTLIRWKVQALILKGTSIFVHGGEAAVGWHLCKICSL